MEIYKSYRSENDLDSKYIALFINNKWVEIWNGNSNHSKFSWVSMEMWDAIKDEDPRTIIQIAELNRHFKGKI